jgi:hypothetical protein
MADRPLHPYQFISAITMASSRSLFCSTGICFLLTACGGGGGGATGSTAALPVATSAVSNFSSLVPPTSFAWSSQQSASTSGIAIVQSSGAVLGNVRVTVSNFIETDPTGSGATIPTMSTDVLVSALGGNPAGPVATISFGQLTLPSGTQQVFIEVFSTADGSRLGAGKLGVSSLLAGNASLRL